MNSTTWEQQEIVRLLQNAPGTMYQEADDTNRTIMRDWVRSLLQRQPVTVTFIKADGSERAMRCTTNWDHIPESEKIKPITEAMIDSAKKPRKEPDPAVFRVFDLDKSEWRSFRIDRLKSITAELKFS